jgi:hypothetical protein
MPKTAPPTKSEWAELADITLLTGVVRLRALASKEPDADKRGALNALADQFEATRDQAPRG